MEGDSLAGDGEFFGYGLDVMGFGGDHADDGAPGGVGDGLEYVASGFHDMQVFACKYMRKNLLAQVFLQNFLRGVD
jgi:hypothetical protein